MSDKPSAPPIGSAAWLEAALRDRLGPTAKAGTISFEGKLLRIAGARLPYGGATLAVEQLEVELGAGLPLGPLPISARLVSLRGELVLAGARIALHLESDASTTASWFSGSIRASTTLGPLAVELFVAPSVTPLGIRFTDGRLSAGPLAFVLSGSAARRDDGVLVADLTAAAERTRLAVGLVVDADGIVDGSRLSGSLSLGDATKLAAALAISAPFGVVPNPGSVLELDLAATGPISAPALRGRVFSAAVDLGRGTARTGALRFEELSAILDLDRRRLRYEQLQAGIHGARLAGWGSLPFGSPSTGAEGVPIAALSLSDGGVGVLSALASLAGIPVRAAREPTPSFGFHVPPDLAFSGEIMIRPDFAAGGAFTVTTPRSELHLRFTLTAGGALVGSTLRGRIAADDALTLGLLPGPVRPRPPAVLELDGRLGGTFTRPTLTGRVESRHAILDVFTDPERPSFVVEDISALLDLSPDRLTWQRLAGRFYGGTFASSGRVGFGDAAGLDATLSWSAVRVEALPTHAVGESLIASVIQGAATGELHFTRHDFGEAPLTARGAVVIAEPRYLITRMLAEPLAGLGLPRLRSRGRGPLRALVRLDRDEIFVDALEAAVEGIELSGDVRLGLDGRLGGRVVAHLLASYLAESPVLAIPAAFAERVTVPVDLGGTVLDPEIRTDGLAILEGLLVENRVGDAMNRVLDDIFGAARPRRTRRPPPRR
ncbi:Hypothetical protein A7982_06551 [Minicystis rosea]|nr:Hypothetical protein A7982_06551 [Minicystis rosea]